MNFKQITFLFGLILLLVSTGCSDEETFPEPENLINETQMVEVLSDICKVEARFQRRLTINNVNNTEMVLHNYNVVFDEHKITLVQFKDSYAYYEKSPVRMQQIYDSVIVHLTEEQALLKQTESKTDSTTVD